MNLKIDPDWLLKMSENDDGIYSVGGFYCKVLEKQKNQMTINGRYPQKSSVLWSDNMTVEFCSPSKESIYIRVDDNTNPDFWMEIGLKRENLEEMLRKMDEAEE